MPHFLHVIFNFPLSQSASPLLLLLGEEVATADGDQRPVRVSHQPTTSAHVQGHVKQAREGVGGGKIGERKEKEINDPFSGYCMCCAPISAALGLLLLLLVWSGLVGQKFRTEREAPPLKHIPHENSLITHSEPRHSLIDSTVLSESNPQLERLFGHF